MWRPGANSLYKMSPGELWSECCLFKQEITEILFHSVNPFLSFTEEVAPLDRALFSSGVC